MEDGLMELGESEIYLFKHLLARVHLSHTSGKVYAPQHNQEHRCRGMSGTTLLILGDLIPFMQRKSQIPNATHKVN